MTALREPSVTRLCESPAPVRPCEPPVTGSEAWR
jgi:hypothetical protein